MTRRDWFKNLIGLAGGALIAQLPPKKIYFLPQDHLLLWKPPEPQIIEFRRFTIPIIRRLYPQYLIFSNEQILC